MCKGKNRQLKLSMVYDKQNIIAADKEARRGKSKYYGVRKFDQHHDKNMNSICQRIRDGTYHTGAVTLERRFCDKKWRVLCKAHYYDHVAHHALMRIIMPVLERSYHPNSAASIHGRGIHYQLRQIRNLLSRNKKRELWTAEIDFTKCYHHIRRQQMYDKLCRAFHDPGIRRMLHDVIYALGSHNGLEESDGEEGVGIGLYPTQPLVNFYFNDLDRIGNSVRGVVMYRYCDNLYFIGFNLQKLHDALRIVQDYIAEEIKQPIHDNIAVQKIDGVHFVNAVGYKIYKTHVLLRNDTKFRFKRRIKRGNPNTLSSYKGWLQYCNGLHLWKTATGMNKFSDLNFKPQCYKDNNGRRILEGDSISLHTIDGKEVNVIDYEDDCISKYTNKDGSPRYCAWVQIEFGGEIRKFSTSSSEIIEALQHAREKNFFPFMTTIASQRQGRNIVYRFT